MKIKAVYENKVLKPLQDLDLLDELGEPEAGEDIDAVLKEMRTRKYYD
jgi:predicted DNA-binding antitoxin AbrB/MazE fold protein